MSTNVRGRLLPLFLTIFVVLFWVGPVLAQTLTLTAPSLANVRGRLTARFGVSVAELPVLKGELMDGDVLVLKCRVGLYKDSAYWLDDEISMAYFWSSVKYDTATNEFVMKLASEEALLRGSDLGQLLARGWSKLEIQLGSWALLDRGQKYSLKIDTSLKEQGAHEGLMRYVFFWDWESGSDNSFQLDFTY
ncbi:DUF4390 domain-containing protein [Pseudodesulfovibrio sediminis]|uniref:DUF4390 domain-containing protein n=1 Tax=Pseudodesulfovibrio sediminis TaxID=2810563 RepID=A0ABM7P873_9BACT|nr:DUF4390 domain-containing protein [Pseudodesulfovibrio sediminis]BCS89159.1 hypothetical protein PSDVSF_24010 [Pseudodesulfovibrio sediminis]